VKFSAISSDPYPVKVLCRVLRVSRSGYYAWKKRRESRRQGENRRLVEAIYRIHHAVKQRYGSPRIYRELLAQGYVCGVHRVARLMRQEGLLAKRTIRFRSLTKAGTRGWAAPNVSDRHFTVSKPNTVWATDISYIPTGEGHLYLPNEKQTCLINCPPNRGNSKPDLRNYRGRIGIPACPTVVTVIVRHYIFSLVVAVRPQAIPDRVVGRTQEPTSFLLCR
jgi:hypothetical protein